MARIDGGEMVVRVLERAGVRHVFTLHGGHLDPIYRAGRGRLQFVDMRHEQAAGHAADGWARTTGGLGVALVTAGPGVTDVVTAVANAFLDGVPILVIGGAAPLAEAERLPLQGGFDQVALLRPVTKWAQRISHAERIPDLVAQGIRTATSGRPGPVFLEIPVDVLFGGAEEDSLRLPRTVAPPAPAAPAPEAVETVLDWLAEAERPLVLAGGGVLFSRARADIAACAERLGVPVAANGKAKGCIPPDHPLFAGGVATLAALAQGGTPPDLVLLLGARLGLFTSGARLLAGTSRVVQVDVEPEEIGRNREIELAIAADCGEALRALDAAAAAGRRDRRDRSGWLERVREARELPRRLFAAALEGDEPPIHPFRLAHEVARAAGPQAVLVADGGETATWLDFAADVHGCGRWLSHGYLGCLGTGLPFAVAAKLAHPDRPVVCVIGDGSVGLNLAEFDTMARHRLGVVTVVNNDRQWGMSAHGQDLLFGEGHRVATDLAAARYDRAAEGLGCDGVLVERPGELADALERALASGRPTCINALTDPRPISPVTLAMVGPLMGAAGEGAPPAT